MARSAALAPAEPDLTSLTSPRMRRWLRDLEEALGGRQGLVDTLAAAPFSPELDYLIRLLADPTVDTADLAQVCQRAGVTPGEFLQLVKTATLARAQVDAIRQVAAGLSAVVEDLVRRAGVHEVGCSKCEGLGTVPGDKPDSPPTPCARCKGTGQVTVLPALDRQLAVLELMGLGGNAKGAPAILIQQAFGQGGANGVSGPGVPRGYLAPDTLLKFQQATDEIIYGRDRAPGGGVLGSTPADAPDAVPPTVEGLVE